MDYSCGLFGAVGSAHLNKATAVTIIIRATAEALGLNPGTVSLLCASGTLRSRGGLQVLSGAATSISCWQWVAAHGHGLIDPPVARFRPWGPTISYGGAVCSSCSFELPEVAGTLSYRRLPGRQPLELLRAPRP